MMEFASNKLEEWVIRVLNDRRIFTTPYITKKKKKLPELFPNKEWEQLKEFYKNGDKIKYTKLICEQLNKIEKEYYNTKWESELRIRSKALRDGYCNKQTLLEELFAKLKWYGVVVCNLPNMDDFGIVIERHGEEEVKYFFTDKIKRVKENYKRNALKAALQYTLELYSMNMPKESIAYFIRKLDSLIEYWGLLDG